MEKTALVPIADGSEEIEAVTIIDVLRRAGTLVTVASVNNLQISASRGVNLVADCLIGDCAKQTYDLVALPGGMPGAECLRDNAILKHILVQQRDQGRLYAAICAAPAIVLETHGLLSQRRATCHPDFKHMLSDASSTGERVVYDANCVTSQGAGTALEFALMLVEVLFGREQRDAVAAPMIVAG